VLFPLKSGNICEVLNAIDKENDSRKNEMMQFFSVSNLKESRCYAVINTELMSFPYTDLKYLIDKLSLSIFKLKE